MDKYSQLMLDIKNALEEVAEKLDVHPQQITKSQLIKHSVVTDYKLKMIGGLTNVKKKYFHFTDKALAEIQDAKTTQSYINSLEKRLGEKLLSEKSIKEALKSIKPIKVTPCKIKKPRKGKEEARQLVLMINDPHYGLVVKPEEVGNVNQFNWRVAARRTALLVKNVCDYKRDKRPYTDALHLIINGDLIPGVIHGNLSRDHELWVNQMNGALHILIHVVKHAVENFRKVEVHFAVGNHGDVIHRREGGRVNTQVFDNYESAILYALSAAFRKTKSVRFNVNKSIYNSIDLPAGRLIFTHGHLLFKELGNPGNKVDTKSLSDAIMRFNNGERKKGFEPAKFFLFGHTHSHFYFTTPDGCQVYNAPSLSGVDPFAMNNCGVNHNLVGQLLFESTKGHLFGDNRLIELQVADDNAALDKIIPPYKNELVWGGNE